MRLLSGAFNLLKSREVRELEELSQRQTSRVSTSSGPPSPHGMRPLPPKTRTEVTYRSEQKVKRNWHIEIAKETCETQEELTESISRINSDYEYAISPNKISELTRTRRW